MQTEQEQYPLDRLIRLRRHEGVPHIYDVEIGNVGRLKSFDSVECHIVLYPYSRLVGSNDYTFYPFEEYVNDVNTDQRSAYTKIPDTGGRLFGLVLAVLIGAFCLVFDPGGLMKAEVLIAIFGAYFLGRDFWNDIENLLVSWTANWPLSFRSHYYAYRQEKNSTLINYSAFAKKNRYGQTHLLPQMIDFITQSNSETLRMYFDGDNIGAVAGETAHLCSIHIDREKLDEFEREGFMFGVKASFNNGGAAFCERMEVFQSLSNGEPGCINHDGEWEGGGRAFYRKVFSVGRVRHVRECGLLDNIAMIEKSGDEPQPQRGDHSNA